MKKLSYKDVEKLEEWSTSCSIHDYCFNFADLLGISILSAKTINYILSKNEEELFPEFNNCSKNFNEANLEFILSFFININNINLDWFINDFEVNKKDYAKEILDPFSKNYVFNNISFNLFEALSKKNGVNLYLFLFFIPQFKREDVTFIGSSSVSVLAYLNLDFGIYKHILKINCKYNANKEGLLESIIDMANIDDIENRIDVFKQKVMLFLDYNNGKYNVSYREKDYFFNKKLEMVNDFKKEWMFKFLKKNLKMKNQNKGDIIIKI